MAPCFLVVRSIGNHKQQQDNKMTPSKAPPPLIFYCSKILSKKWPLYLYNKFYGCRQHSMHSYNPSIPLSQDFESILSPNGRYAGQAHNAPPAGAREPLRTSPLAACLAHQREARQVSFSEEVKSKGKGGLL